MAPLSNRPRMHSLSGARRPQHLHHERPAAGADSQRKALNIRRKPSITSTSNSTAIRSAHGRGNRKRDKEGINNRSHDKVEETASNRCYNVYQAEPGVKMKKEA